MTEFGYAIAALLLAGGLTWLFIDWAFPKRGER